MKEVWKDVVGYDGLYQVSNLGRVKSRFKILKMSGKYLMVNLKKNKIGKREYVHRLVAIAFIPNPKNKTTVNHKDGNKHNNLVDNLEWNTYSENINHAFDNNLNNLRGENSPLTNSTNKMVEDIRKLKNIYTQRELARIFNVSLTTINRYLNYKTFK